MSLGPCIYAGWFGILIASQFIAGSHLNQRGITGVVKGFTGIAGAFLCWAFISAYCGVMEMPDYLNSWAFTVSMGVGVVGFLMFLLSCLTIKKTKNQVFDGGVA